MSYKIPFISFALMVSATVTAVNPPIQKADYGSIERRSIYSPQMKDTITIDIWLPEDYATSGLRYPVIYAHDGQNLFDASTTWNGQSWELDSVMRELTEIEGIIPPVIVGIHSFAATRVADLMPEKAVDIPTLEAKKIASGLDSVPVRGDEYATFIVQTLKPAIDAFYRTIPDEENTAVMGSSMGGLMSIYSLCENPSVFGTALCLSTHWIGSPELEKAFSGALYNYIDRNLPLPSAGKKGKKIYFDHGTRTLDAYYGPAEARMIELVESKGYDSSSFMHYVDEEGAHEERSWAGRVAIPLRFFLKDLKAK